MRAPTSSAAKAILFVPLTAGTVRTEIVIAASGGGVQVVNLVDAARSGQLPRGGVSAGFGGTMRHGPGLPLPWLAVIGAGALLTLAGGLRLHRKGLRQLTTVG